MIHCLEVLVSGWYNSLKQCAYNSNNTVSKHHSLYTANTLLEGSHYLYFNDVSYYKIKHVLKSQTNIKINLFYSLKICQDHGNKIFRRCQKFAAKIYVYNKK